MKLKLSIKEPRGAQSQLRRKQDKELRGESTSRDFSDFYLGASIKDVHTPWGMGGGGLAKSVRFVDKGEGEGFRIVYVRIHFSRRLFTEVTTYDKKLYKYL